MNQIQPNHFRLMGIEPTTKGFGYVVMEGQDTLVDWGFKSVKGDKNRQSLAKVKYLLSHFEPDVLVLQDTSARKSRRSARIKELSQQIIALANESRIKVTLFSVEQVKRHFFEDGKGAKHTVAKIIAGRFPEELGLHLPPKRRIWKSESCQMGVFDAAALVLVYRMKKPWIVGEE